MNSSGLIIRFSRRCIEVKAIDEQECVKSDMAICAFLSALIRSDVQMEEDREALLDLTDLAIQKGTVPLRPELLRMLSKAKKSATGDETKYLNIIEDRIINGNIAERMKERFREEADLAGIMSSMELTLRTNQPYIYQN